MFKKIFSIMLIMAFASLVFGGCKWFEKEEVQDSVDVKVEAQINGDEDAMEEEEVVEGEDVMEEETEEETTDEDVVMAPPTIEELKEAFLVKHPDWDIGMFDNNVIEMATVSETHAQGSLSPADGNGGGGYWFAANTSDGWIIAADGNGVINCDEIEPYDFPTDMIPECYDQASGTTVQR